MCIRDRAIIIEDEKRAQIYLKGVINQVAVSYTHLDVYKRQALAPGEYSIQLGLMNKNTSEINFTVKPITFEISPPLWKRAWFITIIICSFFLMSFLLYRWKILQLKKKNAEKIAQITLEKNLKESKLQLIKSQMNPHFFFNAINNIQSYIFTNDTHVASAYLSKFSKLTRKILELSDTCILYTARCGYRTGV